MKQKEIEEKVFWFFPKENLHIRLVCKSKSTLKVKVEVQCVPKLLNVTISVSFSLDLPLCLNGLV